MNQEYDHIKTEISKENLKVQEIKAKNDELNQLHEQKINEISKAKNELAFLKDKMLKIKEEKAFLIAKVLKIYKRMFFYLKKIKNKETQEEKIQYLGKIENLKNKFSGLAKKNKESANYLEDFENQKNKIEQKNLILLKALEEVNFFSSSFQKK